MTNKSEISKAVIQRLPRYYRNLLELHAQGVERISSRLLAEHMGLTASQIRQDFNCFGGFGQQGYGYNVEKLIAELRTILGLAQAHTAILIGVGNLGRALLGNFDFAASGFDLLSVFDCAPTLIGKDFGGHIVQDVDGLCDFIQSHHPDAAILTLSRMHAPAMAKYVVEQGVRGLWNFTGEDLHMEGLGVPVVNVHLTDSLMTLCYMIGNEKVDSFL